MQIGIVINPDRPSGKSLLPEVRKWLQKKGVGLLDEPEINRADIVLAMGGDGTLLKTARLIGGLDIPILGVNLGSLGFLTEVVEGDIFSALESVLNNNYRVEERMALSIEIDENRTAALNDIVLSAEEVGRMIKLDVVVGGDYLSEMTCDGLIVSTPTGSTAYSLSAGGPIVVPTLNAVIVTPVCAHTLSMRPMVLPPESVVKVKTTKGRSSVCCDGQVKFPVDGEIKVERGEHTIKLIRLGVPFFEILRKKLSWG